jgi:hypothetical protein
VISNCLMLLLTNRKFGLGYSRLCITHIDTGEVHEVAKPTIHLEQGIGRRRANSLVRQYPIL